MNANLDLRKVERTAWCLFNFKDGLWDISLGAAIIYFGSGLWTDSMVNKVKCELLLLSLLVGLAGKSLITNRRLGQVHFKKNRTYKIAISFTAVVVLAIAIVPLIAQRFEIDTKIYWDLCGTNCNLGIPVYSNYGIAWLAAAAFACFVILAFSLDTKRLYIYGILYAIAVVLRETIDRPFGNLSFSIAGSIVILTGLIMFLRFLKEYPPLDSHPPSIESTDWEDDTNPLKQAKREKRTIDFQDGLWDIFIGLLLIGMGTIEITGGKWPYLIWGAALLYLVASRRLFTIPRVGDVAFGPELKTKRQIAVVLLTTLVSLGIALLILTATGKSISDAILTSIFDLPYVMFAFSCIVYLVFRARLYGLLLITICTGLSSTSAAISFMSGSAVLIFGLVLLTCFIRKYPKITNIQTPARGVKDNA